MDPYIRTRTLEITVLCGENLYVDGNPVDETANVAVRTESIKSWSTKMAKGSSVGYPQWNEKLLVEMPLHARSITLEVQCKTSKGSVRSIGVARIAVSDILQGDAEAEAEGTLQKEGCLHVLSYRLRNWEGRRNGVLNFSARVVKKKKKEEEECERDMKVITNNTCGAFKHDMNAFNNNDGLVIGVPLWWTNHLGIHV